MYEDLQTVSSDATMVGKKKATRDGEHQNYDMNDRVTKLWLKLRIVVLCGLIRRDKKEKSRVGVLLTPSSDLPVTSAHKDARVAYDVMLSRIDADYGQQGQHMFYKISALHNHVQGMYILWTRWGSVGEDGQYQLTPYITREECVAEFLKVFKSKTSFPWAERVSGVPKAGRYSVQPSGGKTLAELQLERLKNLTPRMLPNSLQMSTSTQFLLRVLTDTQMLVANMVQGRPFRLPFGAAQQTAIKEAITVLHETRDLFLHIDELDRRRTILFQDKEEDDDEGDTVCMLDESAKAAKMEVINKDQEAKLLLIKSLSEKFYALVPAQRSYEDCVGC